MRHSTLVGGPSVYKHDARRAWRSHLISTEDHAFPRGAWRSPGAGPKIRSRGQRPPVEPIGGDTPVIAAAAGRRHKPRRGASARPRCELLFWHIATWPLLKVAALRSARVPRFGVSGCRRGVRFGLLEPIDCGVVLPSYGEERAGSPGRGANVERAPLARVAWKVGRSNARERGPRGEHQGAGCARAGMRASSGPRRRPRDPGVGPRRPHEILAVEARRPHVH